jgi:hypothetical protein
MLAWDIQKFVKICSTQMCCRVLGLRGQITFKQYLSILLVDSLVIQNYVRVSFRTCGQTKPSTVLLVCSRTETREATWCMTHTTTSPLHTTYLSTDVGRLLLCTSACFVFNTVIQSYSHLAF